MATHRGTWKRRERNAAAIFGARRQVCSGSSGRPDRSRSDSTHERLYIETKMRASSAVRSLWESTKILAGNEGKVPVLIMYDKGKCGGLIVVHEDHAEEILVALIEGRRKREENGRQAG